MDHQTLGNKRGYALLLTIAVAALVAPLGLFALMQSRVDLLLARPLKREDVI